MRIKRHNMVKIKDNIYYIGVNKENCVSDNAYLITGEKNALIDTVSDENADEYIKNIENVMPIKEISYLIFTHTEPHCQRSIELIRAENPDIEIIGTIPTVKNLKEITNTVFNERIAKNNSELDLGAGMTLRFTVTPNLPCPDSMIIFLENSGALFCGCLFASDYSGEDLFNTDFKFAADHYKNNLLPFAAFVRGAIEKVPKTTNLIAPKNGGIVTDGARDFIKKYAELTAPDKTEKRTVAVCYLPDGGHTAKMADTIVKALSENGVNVYSADASKDGTADALNGADALIVGAATVHRNAKKEIWNAITSLNAVRVNGKPYFVFGSYGWSGEGLELVHQHLKMLRMKPFVKPVGVLYAPSDKDIRELEDLAARFAEALL